MDAINTKILLGFALLGSATTTHALELRYGSGDFTMGAAAKPFVDMDVTLDVDTWTLAEPHRNIGDSRLYYTFRADYFDSDTINRMTDLASLPLTTDLPLVGSSLTDLVADNTSLPVPADYRIHGTNLDAGIGYDVLKNDKGHVGVGVNTGVSTPFMKVRNMLPAANLALEVMDTFDTKITTYKAGVSVQGSYEATPWLQVSGNASLNHQTGEMDNGLVGSGIDMDGSYRTLEVAARIRPATLLKQPALKNAFISIGHTRSDWDYDSADIETPVGGLQVPGMFDADFKHAGTWIGAGYDF